MDDERHENQIEARQQSDVQHQEAVDRYRRAQGRGSLEGERAALQALDVQTLQNRLDGLEQRVTRLEDEVQALKGGQHGKPV